MTGFRTWTDEDRLDADSLNGYLMAQVVPRFTTTADREAVMGIPDDGQLSYVGDAGLQYGVAGSWVTLFDTTASHVVVEGADARMGVAVLVAGTVDVATVAVAADSRIVLTAQDLGTVTVPSALTVSARTAGVSFTILASQATDTSTVAWLIIDPA